MFLVETNFLARKKLSVGFVFRPSCLSFVQRDPLEKCSIVTQDCAAGFRLVPSKLIREWRTLLVAGEPLYDRPIASSEGEEDEDSFPSAYQLLEHERKQLLNETDFNEYRVCLIKRNHLHTLCSHFAAATQ